MGPRPAGILHLSHSGGHSAETTGIVCGRAGCFREIGRQDVFARSGAAWSLAAFGAAPRCRFAAGGGDGAPLAGPGLLMPPLLGLDSPDRRRGLVALAPMTLLGVAAERGVHLLTPLVLR